VLVELAASKKHVLKRLLLRLLTFKSLVFLCCGLLLKR
jgi:hypothetical protein